MKLPPRPACLSKPPPQHCPCAGTPSRFDCASAGMMYRQAEYVAALPSNEARRQYLDALRARAPKFGQTVRLIAREMVGGKQLELVA